MGPPFTPWISSQHGNAAIGVFGNVLGGVVPVFLFLADFVFAGWRASCSKELPRILRGRRISSPARIALLDDVPGVLSNRCLCSLQNCLDDPHQAIYAE